MKKLVGIISICLIGVIGKAQDNAIVLNVGNDNITLSEFKSIFFKNNHSDSIITKEYLDDYMRLFVNFRLKVKEAKELKYDTSKAFINELDMYRNQLAKSYLTDNQFDEQLVLQAYDRMQYDVDASHILVAVDEKAIPSDTIKAYNKALEIRNKIIGGMNFSVAAKQYSDDKSAVYNEGNLGYFTVFMMVYTFENAAYNTKVGEVSMPIRTKYGYHLLKINDKRKAKGEIKVAHIMFKLAKDAKEEDINGAKLKIEEIEAKLKNGEDFAALAQQFSEDRSSAGKGGILPWFGVGKMVKEFEDATFSIEEIGAVSRPFRTEYGWHIVKLVERKEIPTFEQAKDEIQRKIKQDSRSSLRDKAFIMKLKKEYHFNESEKYKLDVLNLVDETLIQGKWEANRAIKLNKTLFNIGDKYYSQTDFAQFIMENQTETNLDVKAYFEQLYQAFVVEKCLEYEKNRLEIKYPEFRLLLQEYSDGILLFDLMDERVWSKAINDTLGMQKYFEDNKESYYWDERVRAKIYTCVDENIAKRTLQYIKRGKTLSTITDAYILEKINKTSPLNLQINEGVFSKEDNDYMAQAHDGIGISKIIKGKDGAFVVVDIVEKIEPMQKALAETKGKVIADYQNYLETKWLQELRSKYPVIIHSEVLNTLIKQ